MERRFKAGDRVKVISVPPNDVGYQGLLGKRGVVDGDPWEDSHGEWCSVVVDGDTLGSDFKIAELAPANPIYEVVGVVKAGSWGGVVGNESISSILYKHTGKRIHITIEVLEDSKEDQPK